MSGRPAPPRFHQLRTATRGDPDRSDGSRTITVEDPEDDEKGEGSSSSTREAGVLRLRGGPGSSQRVTWQNGTVDNEFLNRKKSKICCIYHKAKPKNFEDPFADSSSDSSSDNDDDEECSGDSDEGPGEADGGDNTLPLGQEQKNDEASGQRQSKKGKHKHKHDASCSHGRAPPPNAYEHQPIYGSKKGKKAKTKTGGSSTMTVTQTEEQ